MENSSTGKRGRPRLAPERKRGERFTSRFTAAVGAMIRAKAHSRGVDPSLLITQMICEQLAAELHASAGDETQEGS